MGETTLTTDLDAQTVTPHLARLVLGHFQSGDPSTWLVRISQGEFAALTFACDIDSGLLDSLAKGFPGLVAAVRLVRERGGTDELMSIARSDR